MKNAGTDVSADDYNAKFSVGQYVKFGIYRQAQSQKSNEPIEWQVLDRDGDNALLLSRKCLDVQQYNEEACTWETSWLRGWLNGTFLDTAFSAKEQTAILLTDVDNSASQGNPEFSEKHVDGGNNTQDKVFLLSYAEANKYLEIGSEQAKTSLTECALLAAGSDNEKSSTSAAPEQIQKPLELTYRRTADATKKRLTKVMPDVSLYPHYNRIRSSSISPFPGVKIVVNAGGTEYRFVSLRELTENEDMDDCDYDYDAEEEAAEKEKMAVYERAVAKDTEKYDLDQKAKKMQSLFHVSESAFDPRHDRECELEEGYLHRAYMLSGLRSFAWTLADYCKQQNCTPDEIDSGEASRIADFVAGQNWLNYDGTTYCKGLCSGMDIHVFFIPDESDPADREKLLPSQEDFDRVKRMREIFPAYNEVLPEVHSLNALRKDLAYIYPAIQVMWDDLAKDRNYDEALLGNEADIVYAWCALALAAKDPFFSGDGPMTCYFSRILSEEEKRAKDEEKRAKDAERWLQEYGKYVETNPLIDINGALFVFTGLGHAEPKKENPVVQKLIEKGGQYRSSISGRTNYLVVNPREAGESKIEAVLGQREKGKNIKVIFLEDLKKVLGMKEPEQDAVSDSETSPTNDSAKAMSIPNGKKTISEDALRGSYEAKAWWLRSPGETQSRAMCVAIDGSTSYDDEVVAVQGVRPALWVDLKSLQTSEESGENKEAAKTSANADIVGDAAKESKRKRAKAKKYSRKQVFGKYDGLGGDVVIPDGIRTIGYRAFYGCENLTSVRLPEGLEEIGDSAFYECKSLTNIEIPSSVEHIGENAFRYCENLTSVSLPEGLEEIGDSAFYACKNLCSIEIPSSVKRIGEWAFDGCKNLTSVSLPEGLEEIGDCAFSVCNNLRSIEIPNGVRTIGEWAFRCCENLTSVRLPEGLEGIGDYAFNECKNLRSIEIPNGVRTIGNGAFWECGLTNIKIPASLTDTIDDTFRRCYYVETIIVYGEKRSDAILNAVKKHFLRARVVWEGDEWDTTTSENMDIDSESQELTWYNGSGGDLVIPDGIKKIGDNAFYACTGLTGIEIPSSVESIGNIAFEGCTGLISVEIPSSVKNIGVGAFMCCKNLTSVSLPEGLEGIGDYAFYKCKNLRSIEIPNGVRTIGEWAFRCCENLTSVSLPEGLEGIGDSAFYECKNLRSIEIPNGVRTIGEWAFRCCENLTSVSLPEGLEGIGDSAFYECKNLRSIEIPNGVRTIGEWAFRCCENLTSIRLPEGIKEIRSDAFGCCEALERVRIPASLTEFDKDVFDDCDSLETVIVYGDRYSSETLDAIKEHFPENVSVIWEDSKGSADAGKSPAARDSAASDVRRRAANDEGCRILSYNDEIQFALPEDMDDCQMIWSIDEDGSTECNIVMGEYTDDDGETAYHLKVSVAVVDGNIDEEKDWAFSDEESSGGLYNVTSQWSRYSDRIGMRVIEFEMLHGFSTFYMAMLYVQLDQKKQIRFTNKNLGSDEDEREINAMFMRCITDALRYQGNALILPSIGDEAEPGRHLERYNDEIYFDLTKDYQVTWGKSGGAPLFIITKGKCDEEKENNPFMAFIREEDISEEIEPGRSLLDIIHQRLPEYRQLSLSTEPEAVLGMVGPLMHKGEQMGIDWCLCVRVSDTQMVRLAICILKKGYEDAHEYIKELVKALRYKGNAIRTIELTDAELDKLEEPLGSDAEDQSDSAVSPQKDSHLDERVAPVKTTPPAPAKAAAPSGSTAGAEPRPAAEAEAAAASAAPTRRRRSQAQRLAELEKQEKAAEQAKRVSEEEKPVQEEAVISVKTVDPAPPVVSGKPFVPEEQDDPEEQERKWKKIRRRRNAGKFLIAVGIGMILLFGVGMIKGHADVNDIWAMIAGALEIGLGATWTKQE